MHLNVNIQMKDPNLKWLVSSIHSFVDLSLSMVKINMSFNQEGFSRYTTILINLFRQNKRCTHTGFEKIIKTYIFKCSSTLLMFKWHHSGDTFVYSFVHICVSKTNVCASYFLKLSQCIYLMCNLSDMQCKRMGPLWSHLGC